MSAYLWFEWTLIQRNSLAQNFNIFSKNAASVDTVTNQSQEQIEILGFADEGQNEKLSLINNVSSLQNSVVSSSIQEIRQHSVISFLQRVYQIDNFQWNLDDTAGEVLRTYRFPDVLLKQLALSKKVMNFFGLRAGVEFIVLVNKQPFQQGNLLISFLPGAKYNPAKFNMCKVESSSNLNLPVLTGMSRVNLDLMDSTRATLTVPYVSPFIYYNLLTHDGTIGDFIITVYSKLRDVAANGSVSVQVMARFVDVDVQFPAGTQMPTLVSSSNILNLFEKFSFSPSLSSIKEVVEEGNKIIKDSSTSFVFQMNSDSGSCLNIKPKALPGMANADLINNAHFLSVDQNNRFPSTLSFGNAPDEMNFKNIVQIPVYFDRFLISKNDQAHKNVWVKQITLLNYDNKDESKGLYALDYLTYIGQMFSKWHSSFKFTFRFVKTLYHSMRIRIFFAPCVSSVDLVDRNAVISKIIDLKEINQCEFEVPFEWPHPYLNTIGSYATSLGCIGVDIVTKLVSPDTVSNDIEVIVERSAGQDFSVNLPRNINYTPVWVESGDIVESSSISLSKGIATYAPSPIDLTTEGVEPNPGPSFFSKFIYIEYADKHIDINSVKMSVEVPKFENKRVLVQPIYLRYGGDSAYGQILKIKCEQLNMEIGLMNNYRHYAGIQKYQFETIHSHSGGSFDFIVTATVDFKFSIGLNINIIDDILKSVDPVVPSQFPSSIDVNLKEFPSSISLNVSDLNINMSGKEVIPPPPPSIPLVVDVEAGDRKRIIGVDFAPEEIERRRLANIGNFEFQMNNEQDIVRQGFDEVSYTRPYHSIEADKMMCGQAIQSVKQMIMKASGFHGLNVTTKDLSVFPHFIGITSKDANSNLKFCAHDCISYFGQMYAFAVGGVNLRVYTDVDASFDVYLDPDAEFVSKGEVACINPSNTLVTADRQSLRVALQQIIKPQMEGYGVISIPFYSDTSFYYVAPRNLYDVKKSNSHMTLPYSSLLFSFLQDIKVFIIFRSACDDFQFSYLTGPPICTKIR